ncbi:MAG: argininosuccinate lyase [Desulfobacterota bacterium]|nr:argininosuccinate lyase [Thermodesulfobacteriota bacterium]
MKIERLWGGRFEELPSKERVDFLSGRDVKGIPPCDERLIPYDLWGSRVHLLMLYRQKILSKGDAKKLLKGLRELQALYEKGRFKLDPVKEDVHSNVESFLIDRLGMDFGGKIHTGRSRNDQIALDMRLYLRDRILDYMEGLVGLIEALLERAEEHGATVMPGYTHHQPAMVTTFGHLLLSFAEAHRRDIDRFAHWWPLFNQNPLGAAAGYGSSLPLDRDLTSSLLGFDAPTENTLDPITQRWEPEAELAYAVCMVMNHLATLAQTLILLATSEFQMIRLSDRHSTGSSIMPQKRNPDSLEVIKAKSAYAQGVLMSLLSVGKGLFMGYNRETQWTKYWIMDLVDETLPALPAIAEVIRQLQVNKEAMKGKAKAAFIGTTFLMEHLITSYKLPMRQAKRVIEKAVRYAEEEGKEVVTDQALKRAIGEMKLNLPFRPKETMRIQMPEEALSRYVAIGTPSLRRVKENLRSLRKKVKQARSWIRQRRGKMEKAIETMERLEREIER